MSDMYVEPICIERPAPQQEAVKLKAEIERLQAENAVLRAYLTAMAKLYGITKEEVRE